MPVLKRKATGKSKWTPSQEAQLKRAKKTADATHKQYSTAMKRTAQCKRTEDKARVKSADASLAHVRLALNKRGA